MVYDLLFIVDDRSVCVWWIILFPFQIQSLEYGRRPRWPGSRYHRIASLPERTCIVRQSFAGNVDRVGCCRRVGCGDVAPVAFNVRCSPRAVALGTWNVNCTVEHHSHWRVLAWYFIDLCIVRLYYWFNYVRVASESGTFVGFLFCVKILLFWY